MDETVSTKNTHRPSKVKEPFWRWIALEPRLYDLSDISDIYGGEIFNQSTVRVCNVR